MQAKVASGPLVACLKASKNWFQSRVADRLYFPFWLLFQCLRHRRRAVILFRVAALGDIICTLPMCPEIRKRHPQRLLFYVTKQDYRQMVQLARGPDAVYGARSWKFSLPHHFFGLIEKVYAPQTTDELAKDAGPTCHLVDDLAGSCDVRLTDRQPQLFPPAEFIALTLSRHGLTASPKVATPTSYIATGSGASAASKRNLIAINCGRTWPVREWSFERWQQLVNLIHAEYVATILLFGVGEEQNEYTQLKGIESFANHRVLAHELVALIAACDLVISIDSGPVQVAGAVGTPVLGLYGAVNPKHRLPPASLGIGLVADVPCLFCHHQTPRGHWQTGCPNDIRCMKELAVTTVFQAVKDMLDDR
jgi:ADP-heptose:LPS heptosyltransferase